MASVLTYPSARRAIMDGRWHPALDTLRLVLLAESYTPSADHKTYADIAAHEVKGTGYTAKGKALGLRVEAGDTEDRLLCESVSWKPATIKPRYGVLVLESDGTLIQCSDMGPGLYCNVEFRVPGGVIMVLR